MSECAATRWKFERLWYNSTYLYVFVRQMVLWALCRQDCGPKVGSGFYFVGQRYEVELILLNLLCQLYSADRHGRRLESLRMMISWSKCRPLKRSCAEVGSVIPAVIERYRAFQQVAPEPTKASSRLKPVKRSRM